MKLIEYAMAWAALPILTEREFPYRITWELVQLKRRIRSRVEFLNAEEAKLAKRFGELDSAGRLVLTEGRFRFAGETDEERIRNAEEFQRLRGELLAVEDGEVCEKVEIPVSLVPMLSAAALEALEPFIEFTEEG